MKNLFFILFLLLFSSACNQIEPIEKKINWNEQFEHLTTMYSDGIIHSIDGINNQKSPNYADIYISGAKSINNQMFNKKLFSSEQIENMALQFTHKFNNQNGYRLLTEDEPYLNFSSGQISLIDPFIEKILSDSDWFIDNFLMETHLFNLQVENSNLSNEEKLGLLNFSAGVYEGCSFLQGGGIYIVYNELYGAQEISRIMCSVSTRAVLISAVVGGVGSAAAGAYAGGAAGTVAFPGIGTVTGAVGGGMVGLAAGFIGGLVGGIAGELISTCGR